MKRAAEFSKAVKLAAWQRSGGHCESCTAKLFAGNVEYHHDRECTYDGDATIGNCIVLCRGCHRMHTSERVPIIAKSNRVRNAHLGIKRKRSGFATNRSGRFKKRMDGTVVPR